MYEQVFKFNSRPFTSTPYVKHYYPAAAINQALGQASICVERGSGPVVAIGGIGTGKSLLLAKLGAEFQSSFQIVDLVCSGVSSRREFLQNILFQIGKPFNMDSETELRFAVIESAQSSAAFPNGLLLLVDDAEMLTVEIFDEMRALSNIVVDGSPHVRLVLAGRKSLEELLANPALASFSQRIASRVFLSNLTREETAAYVAEHINRVGGDGQTMFPDATSEKLHELTDGCPRLINQVCDFGLILAGTRGSTTISESLIEEAWNDVQSLPMGSNSLTSTSSNQPTANPEDNEWTLIEFGQLEDDSPQPQDATVYDFGSSNPKDESVVESPSKQAESVESQAVPEPLETAAVQAPESNTNVDPELGIDLGSLQAMQDAAAAQEAELTSIKVDLTDELTAQNQSVLPAADTDQPASADDAARVAMEQQLAAVFGTPEPSPTSEPSNEVPTTDLQPALPMESTPAPELTPALDDAQNALGTTVASDESEVGNTLAGSDKIETSGSIAGGITGAGLAASGFAAAYQAFAPEPSASEEAPAPLKTPESDDSFTPATSALGAYQPSTQTTGNLPSTSDEIATPFVESQPASSYTTAITRDESTGFVPATRPIETAQTELDTVAEVPVESQVENTPTSQTTTQLPEAEPDATEVSTSANVSDDPFGESFAMEANIPNRPASDIIEQNQNALKISSSDLTHVQPIHAPTPDQIIHPATSQVSNDNGQNGNGLNGNGQNDGESDGASWLVDPSKNSYESHVDETADIEVAAQAPIGEAAETIPPESFATEPEIADQAHARQPKEPARGFSILPTGKPAMPFATPQPDAVPELETALQDAKQPPAVDSTVPVLDEPASLSEAPATDSFNSVTTHNHDNEVVSDEISRQADAILARLHNANKPAEIDPEEQILADIQSQQREVSDSQLLGEPEQTPASLPIPELELHQDDSEMLVVNQEVDSTPKAEAPGTFPMTDSPISSGRASRMDYEDLFDRLRNLPDGKKK